jgi:hypothetical protein
MMETNSRCPHRTVPKRRLVLGVLAVVVVLTGCGPSIDPAAKADIDARIANLQIRSIVVSARPPGPVASMPPAAGHWVQYKVSLPRGQAKFVTEKIIGEEAGALWYEKVEETYGGRVVEQLLFAVDYRTDPPKVELRAARTKDEKGRVVTLSRADLWKANHGLPPEHSYWASAEGVAHIRRWPGSPREPAVVPAGRFEGCYREHSVQILNGKPWVDDSWSHPDVPLSGLVRWESNHEVLFELVAYGATGARSAF